MKLRINGTLLDDINKTSYGNESELFCLECDKLAIACESISEEFLTDLNTASYQWEGTEGLVWGTVNAGSKAIKSSIKAGKAGYKIIKRNAADFRVYLKKLYEQLQKLIREYGVQLSARWARLMKVGDRYKQAGADVKEIIDFLGKAVGDMPEIIISWHRFDPALLKTMFESVEKFDVFYNNVLKAAGKAEGVREIPSPQEVRQALDKGDKKLLSKYIKDLTKIMHNFNEYKELSIIVGLSAGDFTDLQTSDLLVRMCRGLGFNVAQLFTGGKFKGWAEIVKVKTNMNFRNVSDEDKKKIENKDLGTTGAASFLKSAILGPEFRKTYSAQNSDEFKKDMLGTIGFLTLMSSILNNQIIFDVLKTGSLSVKKETDAKLKEIQTIMHSADQAAIKEENEAKNAKEETPKEDTKEEAKEEKENKEEIDNNASPQDLADLYVKLMGSILSRCCSDYSNVISACLSSTFVLVKETEAVIKTIHSQTTKA